MDAPLSLKDLKLEDRLRISLTSPAPYYMTGEDSLQLSIINSLSGGQTVTIVGRILLLDGRPATFAHTFAVSAARTLQSFVFSLGEGWLLDFSVFATAAVTITGQTFARVQVLRGQTGATSVVATLMAGYITSVQSIAWQGSAVRSSLDGQGNLRSITGTDPAAGVEISEAVPTGARWRLLAISAALVTDATVINRFPGLLIDDGTTTLFSADPPAAQTASQNYRWSAGPGSARLGAINASPNWGLPVDIRLLAGSRIRTSTLSIQAGDNWGAPQLLVEEFLEA